MLRFILALLVGQPLLCAAIRVVCHDEMRAEFRCYDLWPPFTNSLFHLPESPSQQNIHLNLYTVSNPTTAQPLSPQDQAGLRGSNWRADLDTKFIVHGFTGSGQDSWVLHMKDELLLQNVNVIVVDWAHGARGPNYAQATANTRVVGAEIASLVLTAEALGSPASRFHVIGHSLGAQIAGYAGSRLNGRLGRISGLDPAAPLFESYESDVKLEKSDAVFVDVMHTDAQPLHEAGLGTVDNIGHVDFFPNGGFDMPGCPEDKFDWTMLLSGQISAITDEIGCSHNRAPHYYTASINDNAFMAYPCSNPQGQCTVCGAGCSHMGYFASTSRTGVFVAYTGPSYPF